MSSNGSSPHSAPEETDCLVCGSGKSFTKNPILFCDGPDCDIPVHQKCYGVDVVPEGNWYCQRCEDRISVEDTPCCCCPQTTGAFKRTTIPNQYIHVACARFHPDLDDIQDPINFDSALAQKQACVICKSTYGVCSKCSFESCSRVLHVTCAQKESLMTKGKSAQLFCELHRDIGVLSRLMKSRKHKDRRSSSHSSQPGSTPHRSSKRSRNYRESSVSGSDEDSDEDNEEDEEDLDHDGASDEDSDERMDEPTIEESEEEGLGRLKSTQQSSRSGSKGRLRRSQLFEGGQRRKKERSSDSEEIDVDDTEAILGSSTGNVGPLDARKRQKSIKITPKESAAESQRRRLLMSLDKNKRKQSTGGTGIGALASIANLSAMPIRTLGGVGPPAATPPPLGSALGSEPRQKPPGINRYATIGGPFDSASSPSGYSPMNQPSPSLGSSDRFSSNGHSPNSNRDGAAKNLKGLTFELDPAIDMSSIKTSSPLSASAQPSPVVSHFPNPGSPVLARLSERQQHSPRGSISISMAEENRELQAKVTSLESSIQSLTQQLHLLQARSNFNDNPVNASSVHPSSSASSISHTPSSTSSTPSAVATGTSAPAQELQGRFDKLQHQHAQEKIRNLTLRENLQTLFGYLQVPVAIPPGTNDYQGSNVFEWKADKLDEYVQALRDTIIGSESSPGGPSMPGVTPKHPLDTRRRDMIVDRVMREIGM